jgi:SpoVK/Ycf46/Vps4 family AAA+-type ATPase
MQFPGKPIDKKDSILGLRGKPVPAEPPQTPDEPIPAPAKNGKGEIGDKPVSFVPRKPMYSFDQVILPESIRLQFQTLKSRIANHRLLYEDWELDKIDPQGKHIAFNLYGVPGTGKTMCVEALAHELGKDIIDISYAEIESKYVGDTGKNITAAFRAAHESEALLFFDEADSILGRRMTNVTQAADHGVNVARAVMLKQLDAFDGVVAFATNLSKNFDTAFVRRIAQHIEIPLPNAEGRRAIWEKMISPKVPGRENLRWDRLVAESDGFAGGDIKNAIVNALAYVASLEGEHRRVTEEVFLQEIANVHNAKRNVGNSPTIRIKEEIIDALPSGVNPESVNLTN